MQSKTILTWAALLGALAVALGAFGAHGLKQVAEPDAIRIFETAVRYHFHHVFALLALGILAHLFPAQRASWNWSNRLFVAGILIFSGSLYLLTAAKVIDASMGWLGAITPIGGLCFIGGWLMLAKGVRGTSK